MSPTSEPGMALRISELERRMDILEQEKLAQNLALVSLTQKYQGRELTEIKGSLDRMEDALMQLRDTQLGEQRSRQGGERSWRAVWTYIVGGAVAMAAVASPIIVVLTR